MTHRRGEAHIGTSGWQYKHWIGPFYPKGLPVNQHLTYFHQYFKTVEVNNSFYRLPEVTSLRRWYETVPDDFVFAMKASRFITHVKHLKDPAQSTEKLFERFVALEEKLGPILFQLPPRWHADPERLAHFLEVIPKGFRYTFELRDPDWLREDIYDILRAHNAAFCIYELGGWRSEDVVTADWVYIRMHGPENSKYTGSYNDERLEDMARKINIWNDQGMDVYCYFDNDQKGYAVKDAQRLIAMVKNISHVA